MLETDPSVMCELLVGLKGVDIIGVEELEDFITVHVACSGPRENCKKCGSKLWIKQQRVVELVDLNAFGRPTKLLWHKRRLACPNGSCAVTSFTEQNSSICAPRLLTTDRAGRWATLQVGQHGRSVNEVSNELGCSWHCVNDAVMAYGAALVDHPDRYSKVQALGLDETLFVKEGPRRRQVFVTSIVDVKKSTLLDLVPGRDSKGASKWLTDQGKAWCSYIEFGTLDLCGTYRKVFNDCLPDAIQVADPFHVVKLANTKLDQCRCRVQNEVFGHRGRKADPLYRCRRLLTKAKERLDEEGTKRLVGLLLAGDPKGEVKAAWEAKEAVRAMYQVSKEVAQEWVETLGKDLQGSGLPKEIRSLGRTIIRWKDQIAAWHTARVSNGPTEGVNNLIKRVKRIGFGFKKFDHYRIRTLLFAGKPDWSLLATITPR